MLGHANLLLQKKMALNTGYTRCEGCFLGHSCTSKTRELAHAPRLQPRIIHGQAQTQQRSSHHLDAPTHLPLSRRLWSVLAQQANGMNVTMQY